MKRVPTLSDGLVTVGLIFILICMFSFCNPRDSLAWGNERVSRACTGWLIMVVSLILIFGLPWLFIKLAVAIFGRKSDE